MTNTHELRNIIKDSGLKYQFIANQLNITRYGLSKKIKNESEFKASEIHTLCELLNIKSLQQKEEIFFTNKVELNSTKQ